MTPIESRFSSSPRDEGVGRDSGRARDSVRAVFEQTRLLPRSRRAEGCAPYLQFMERIEERGDDVEREQDQRTSSPPLHGREGVFGYSLAAPTSEISELADEMPRFKVRRTFPLHYGP